MRGRVQDKVALITGAASGIGEATAKRFAHEGARVVVVDINRAGAERVAREITATGGQAVSFEADVARAADAEAMIRFAVETFGGLDVLHNNATAAEVGLLADATLQGWERTIAVNLTAPFLATKFAIPAMIRRGGGAIINMSSGAGLMAERGFGAYGAAKAGLISLTRSTAVEYARHNIRANCLCPGAVATPPVDALSRATPGARAAMERSNLLGRLGRPEEIASVVLFLASDEASFITGAAYLVDGGSMASKNVTLISD